MGFWSKVWGGIKKIAKATPVGALIDAGASLIGGRKSQKANTKAADLEYERQKEFAQHGISWKVADAKAAGLHPVFALGSQPANYSPVAVQDSMGPAIAQAGQAIGRSIRGTLSPYEKRMQDLQLQLLESQIGETDARAGLARSEIMRNLQADNSSIGIPSFAAGEDEQQPEGVHILGQHTNKLPPSYISSEFDDSVGANVNPMWSRFNIAKNTEIVLPGGIGGDAAEALESLGESKILLWMTFKENEHRYGKKRAEWLMERYVGDAWEDTKQWMNENFNPFEAYRKNFRKE